VPFTLAARGAARSGARRPCLDRVDVPADTCVTEAEDLLREVAARIDAHHAEGAAVGRPRRGRPIFYGSNCLSQCSTPDAGLPVSKEANAINAFLALPSG
jgi:hypothetical protein